MSNQKTAIITAAGRGIGAGIAKELYAHGYYLALLSPSGAAEHLADELGGVGITGSVTQIEDLQNLVNTTLDTFGRIDAVVNHTGHPLKANF